MGRPLRGLHPDLGRARPSSIGWMSWEPRSRCVNDARANRATRATCGSARPWPPASTRSAARAPRTCSPSMAAERSRWELVDQVAPPRSAVRPGGRRSARQQHRPGVRRRRRSRRDGTSAPHPPSAGGGVRAARPGGAIGRHAQRCRGRPRPTHDAVDRSPQRGDRHPRRHHLRLATARLGRVVESEVRPIVAPEATIVEAHQLARRHTTIPVDPTGTAGLAGLLHWWRTEGPRRWGPLSRWVANHCLSCSPASNAEAGGSPKPNDAAGRNRS